MQTSVHTAWFGKAIKREIRHWKIEKMYVEGALMTVVLNEEKYVDAWKGSNQI
jgi:hypothetical protein